MKWFHILLGIYMTVLAVLPCQDVDDISTPANYTVIQQNHQDKEKSGRETCTPFCTCSCCSSVRTISMQPVIISTVIQPIIQNYADQTVPALADHPFSVWQPPQLA